MTRKIIDCRSAANDVGCTLAITGEPRFRNLDVRSAQTY
jgi:hypothetical protein